MVTATSPCWPKVINPAHHFAYTAFGVQGRRNAIPQCFAVFKLRHAVQSDRFGGLLLPAILATKGRCSTPNFHNSAVSTCRRHCIQRSWKADRHRVAHVFLLEAAVTHEFFATAQQLDGVAFGPTWRVLWWLHKPCWCKRCRCLWSAGVRCCASGCTSLKTKTLLHWLNRLKPQQVSLYGFITKSLSKILSALNFFLRKGMYPIGLASGWHLQAPACLLEEAFQHMKSGRQNGIKKLQATD